MAAIGLDASFAHVENGMIRSDMQATLNVADKFNEVIIFRSTGPWSKRWIERQYPTKNFHVKGKSSDWGPQAGFVPYNGIYSKVGANADKAAAGTRANQRGINEGYAATTQLELDINELRAQLNDPEENPPRRALLRMVPMRSQTRNFHLYAQRTGDNRVFVFRAVFNHRTNKYRIFTLDERLASASEGAVDLAGGKPFLVMTSGEAGANSMPMTGDYDLMAVCPTWDNYMSKTVDTISKPGIVWAGAAGPQPGLTFDGEAAREADGYAWTRGARMDDVLDMRMNTGAMNRRNGSTFQGLTVDGHNHVHRGEEDLGMIGEHGDMGNLTPRILRCINELNKEMNPRAPGGNTPFRRVHHNAESHRNAMFGALKAKDMIDDADGFPMTGFHPAGLRGRRGWTYGNVATLENMTEFKDYAEALNEAGWFVPKNWTWRMSVRDRFATFNPRPRR